MQHRFAVVRTLVVLALSVPVAACYGAIEPLGGDEAATLPDGGAAADDTGASTVTWQKTIAPLMTRAGCTSCHGQQGSYCVETYAATLAGGTDSTPNVIPNDASSELVAYCVRRHGGISASDTDTVRRWVLSGARER